MSAKPKKSKPKQTPLLSATEINNAYLADLKKSEGIVFTRLQEFIVPRHEAKIEELKASGEQKPAFKALDFVGDILRAAYPQVKADIETKIPIPDSADEKTRVKVEQSRRQAVKSNAGKIFERYVGYALATALQGTEWAVWHNRRDAKTLLGFDPSQHLLITKQFEDEEIAVEIEGDLLIARPGDPDSPIILFSIKSTLKERLHNVTMWQLAKNIALDPDMSKKMGLVAKNPSKLERVLYCLACSDTAQEQPDLAKEPRRKIKFDVSFLDYAFAAVASNEVSHLASVISKQGRGKDLFHRMSLIGDILAYIDSQRKQGRSPTVAEVEQVTNEIEKISE